MKKLFLGLAIVSLSLILSCSGDDNTNNPTSGYAIKMNVTGDRVIEFKTNEVVIIPPINNPNYLVTFTMKDGDVNHIFSMTFDEEWLDKKDIDLSRDDNKGTVQFDSGKDTYRIVSGNFVVEKLTNTQLKGTLNFTAVKVGSTDIEINVQNGLVDINK